VLDYLSGEKYWQALEITKGFFHDPELHDNTLASFHFYSLLKLEMMSEAFSFVKGHFSRMKGIGLAGIGIEDKKEALSLKKEATKWGLRVQIRQKGDIILVSIRDPTQESPNILSGGKSDSDDNNSSSSNSSSSSSSSSSSNSNNRDSGKEEELFNIEEDDRGKDKEEPETKKSGLLISGKNNGQRKKRF
jgi:hypothetical protein